MQAGSFPSAALKKKKNLIMENNLMLVNNVKQAALNCPRPAGFIIPSKFTFFLRKQLGDLSFLCSQLYHIEIANVDAALLLCYFVTTYKPNNSTSQIWAASGLRSQFSTVCFQLGLVVGQFSKQVSRNTFVLTLMNSVNYFRWGKLEAESNKLHRKWNAYK